MEVIKNDNELYEIIRELKILDAHIKTYNEGAYPAFYLQMKTAFRVVDILSLKLKDLYEIDDGKIKEELRTQYDIKMLLLDILLYDDLFAAIEREMPKCRQGNVYIPDNRDNSIFDIFKEQAKKKDKKPRPNEIILDSADFDLFDFL